MIDKERSIGGSQEAPYQKSMFFKKKELPLEGEGSKEIGKSLPKCREMEFRRDKGGEHGKSSTTTPVAYAG